MMGLLSTLVSILLVRDIASASVVIIPGAAPRAFSPRGFAAATSEDALFRASAFNELRDPAVRVILSSHSSTNFSAGSPAIYPSGESFFRGVLQAWGEHLHLVIRPDEVWFTILIQMNFYMGSHAESLRDLFVSHQGQQEIHIEDNTWYSVLRRFQYEIQARVKTDWLLSWITPNFTTTTESDVMTSNVLMMGLMKAYFKYSGGITCGLPSVTLLGELSDWKALVAKLDRLPAFGQEPEWYSRRLRPVLSRFVTSFQDPDSPETRLFWNSIVKAWGATECGAPPVWITGWITAFFFWDSQGDLFRGDASNLTLDGVRYLGLDLRTVPVGFAGAPFLMRDYGGMSEFPGYVSAGTMGKRITPGAPEGYADALRRAKGDEAWINDTSTHSTLQPMSGWMLYGPVPSNRTSSPLQLEPELGQIFPAGKRC